MLVGHIFQIRERPEFSECRINIIPEANMSFIATDRIKTLVEELPDDNIAVVPLIRPDNSLDPKGRTGVVTSEHRKVLYVNEIRTLLSMARLKFVDVDIMVGRTTRQDKQTLGEQLKAYKEEIVPGDEYGIRPPKKRYSGKGSGAKDDICLALQLAVYWSMVYKRLSTT